MMTYTVAWTWSGKKEHTTAQFATAKEALASAESLLMSDAIIVFVDTPRDGRGDMTMLRLFAEYEA
jgi:hypothetical protein